MGMVVVAFFAANVCGVPETTIRSTFKRTRSAASSGTRSGFCSANRYSMVMFFPSIHPSLSSSCRNASRRTALPEAVLASRKPMRETFPVCCASASETFTRKRVTSSQRVILFFTFFFSPRASRLLPLSFDQPIRPGEHLRWNRQTDLLSRFEIYHQLKLRGLLHRKFGRLRSLQDSVHEISDPPVAVRVVRPVVHKPTVIYSFFVGVKRR